MYVQSIIFCLLLVESRCTENFPSVTSHSGKIRGHYKISSNGNSYEAYEGIPFAKPPIGNRRFMPPEPIQPWEGEIIADKRDDCIGYHRIPDKNGEHIRGEEDCLHLNIYKPIKEANTSLPIIYWIYGGVFRYSSLSGNEQYYLMDHEVIFITSNYRHGPLGFLSTEDEVVTGNMGLKDQALALKWISENIECFGGDPKKITLVGASSGGVSVHYHYLSKMSRGLFRNGVSMSGTAFNPWAKVRDSRMKAIRLGQLMNCSSSSMVEMVNCLQTRSARSLLIGELHFVPSNWGGYAPFGPVIEKKAKYPFIDRTAIDIINSGDGYDVPWIVSVVSDEGLWPFGEIFTNQTAFEDLDKNWDTIAPHLLLYYDKIPKNDHAAVAKKIRKHYFGNESITQKNFPVLTRLYGDRFFVVHVENAARAQAKVNRNPVWFYYYSYRAETSFADTWSNTTENLGVCHGDDSLLVVRILNFFDIKRPEDLAMQQNLTALWLSLAHHGVPDFGPTWTPVNPNSTDLNYLHIIGPGNFRDTTNDNMAEKKFWSTIDFGENKLTENELAA